MTAIFAYKPEFDISAHVSLFDRRHRVLRRKFFLRNLVGNTLEAQVGEAAGVLAEFGKEIHYITGSGIDKITIQSGRNKVHELVLCLEPHESLGWFHYAIKLTFSPSCTYAWQNAQGLARLAIKESELTEDWKKTQFTLRGKTASFKLPCVYGVLRKDRDPGEDPFLIFSHNIKRRRKTIGWYARYDQKDPVFNSFLARFSERGHLALGERRCFTVESKPVSVVGTYVPAPKRKRSKLPRKTYLASQPADETDYVYVIRMGRKNIFKIGKTNDPQGRLLSLQTASPYRLSMFNLFRADNASAAEESLHAAYRHCRLEGEWFRLSDEQKIALSAIRSFEDGKFVADSVSLTPEQLRGAG